MQNGKGTGYSDQEYAFLKIAGNLAPEALVFTTVHAGQIVEKIPVDEWNFPLDVMGTSMHAW